jgi:hypothetical protein
MDSAILSCRGGTGSNRMQGLPRTRERGRPKGFLHNSIQGQNISIGLGNRRASVPALVSCCCMISNIPPPMAYVTLHSFGLLLLVGLFAATGYVLEHMLLAIRKATFGTSVRRIAFGSVVWIFLVFAISALQLLTRQTVLTLAAVVLISAASVGIAHRPAARNRSWFPAGWVDLGFMGVPVLVLAVSFASAMLPDVGWDAAAYHLTLPKVFIAHGGFREIPFSVYSNWPLNVQLLFALGMLVQDHVLAKLLIVLFLVILCAAVYEFTKKNHSRFAASLAVSLLLANEVVLWEVQVAYIDIAYALYFFLTFVLALQYLDEPRTAWLILAGAFCGVVAGTKMNGIFGLITISGVIVASLLGGQLWRGFRDLFAVVRAIAILAIVTFLFVLPWLVKNYLYTRNPVYPLFYEVFGGPYWSARLGEDFLIWQRSIGMGRTAGDYLLLPVRIFLQADWDYRHFVGRLNPLWIFVLPMTCLYVRNVVVRHCLVAAGIFFCLWAATTQEIRYLIPVMPLLSCAAGIAFAGVTDSLAGALSRTSSRTCLAAQTVRMVIGVVVAGAIQAMLLWMARGAARKALVLVSTVLAGQSIDLHSGVPEAFRFINTQTPLAAKVMLLNTNQGFYLDREFVSDSFFEASQLSELFWKNPTVSGMSSVFHTLGITHVLVHVPNTWDVRYPVALNVFLTDPGRATPLYRSMNGEYLVLGIRR